MRRFASSRRSLHTAVVTFAALASIGGGAVAASAHSLAPDSATAGPVAAVSAQQRQWVKTQRLPDGSVAKIYKVGDRYEAAIFFHGRKIATLSTKSTVFRHHGVNYSFHPYKGSIWAEKSKPGPKPRPGDRPFNPVSAPDDDVTPPVPAPDPTPDDVIVPAPDAVPDAAPQADES
ncbi:hypothetical protein [Streptomyces sp. NPDC091268]|uniref:hypothetical protein n=1 Tax=Streptomyces sp. NPDC091268 TaxID=3365979 RepID=UPI0037F268F1